VLPVKRARKGSVKKNGN
jgi:hypothetical protein